MHNGVISDFLAIRRTMSALISQVAFANINGSTDSEHLAALYMTYLTKPDGSAGFEKVYTPAEMAEAMHKAVDTVIGCQAAIVTDKNRQPRKPNSLNLCATDGVNIVAYRFRNHATSQPPSLYYSTKAGTTLNRKYPDHPDGIDIVSNEGKSDAGDHGEHLVSNTTLNRLWRYRWG